MSYLDVGLLGWLVGMVMYREGVVKLCHACRQTMPESSKYFHRDRTRPDGLGVRCKLCAADYYAVYYERNRDKLLAYAQEYREKNRDAINARRRGR